MGDVLGHDLRHVSLEGNSRRKQFIERDSERAHVRRLAAGLLWTHVGRGAHCGPRDGVDRRFDQFGETKVGELRCQIFRKQNIRMLVDYIGSGAQDAPQRAFACRLLRESRIPGQNGVVDGEWVKP